MLGLGVYVATSVALKHVLGYASGQRGSGVPGNARRVGTLGEVYMFPCKSAAAEGVPEAECTESGPCYQGVLDRQWAVLDTSTKHTVCGRDVPALTTIRTHIQQDHLVLTCRDLPPLTLPKLQPPSTEHTLVSVDLYSEACEGIDCGDAAATWVRNALQKPDAPYRIVFHHPDIQTRLPERGNLRANLWEYPNTAHEAKISYQDVQSFSLVSTATLDDLNARLASKYGPGEYDIQPDQLRYNFVIEGVEQPYEEDDWIEVYIGEQAAFSFSMPLTRCKSCTVNPQTGRYDKRGEPLLSLNKYRPRLSFSFGPYGILTIPAFGVLYELARAGKVKAGDPVYAVTM